MRRMQVAARGGGECARAGGLAQRIGSERCGWATDASSGSASVASKSCLSEPNFANGCCDAGKEDFRESAQQVMFAQQPLLHASLLGAFERMHDAAGNRSGAMHTAAVITTAAIIRLSIDSFVARTTPRVEPSYALNGRAARFSKGAITAPVVIWRRTRNIFRCAAGMVLPS